MKDFLFNKLICLVFRSNIDKMIENCLKDRGCKGVGCDRVREEINKVYMGVINSIEDFIIYDIRNKNGFDSAYSEDWRDRFIHKDSIFNRFFHIVKSVFNIRRVNIKSLIDTNERTAIAVRLLVFNLESFKNILNKSGIGFTEKNRNYYVAYNDAIFRIHNSLDLEEKIYSNNLTGVKNGHSGKDSQQITD